DSIFWHTLVRTIVFTAVNVGLTMAIGTAIALLLVRLSAWARILLTSGLVLVWATPAVVAVQVWIWMTNFQNGIVNYVLTKLHLHPGNYLMGIYLYEEGYVKTDFGRGAAISLLMLAMVALLSIVYVRKMVALGDET